MNDYPVIMTELSVLCGLTCAASIWPALDQVLSLVFAVALVAAALALGVLAVRREIRIRRRLAAIHPLPQPRPQEVPR